MSLTKVYFQNINTNVTTFNDSIVVSNFGNIANRDIGELYDRSQGGGSNVAIIWNETTQSFRLIYTSSSGLTGTNLAVTGNANLRVGTVYAESFSWANGTPFTSAVPGGSVNQLQYNAGGYFAGAGGLTTDGSNLTSNANVVAVNVFASTIGNAGASLVGTISTASQPNITSIGTLTGLAVSGTIDAVTVQANTIGNVGATLIGNGAQLTSITGGQVTGFVANATNAITATYVTGLTGTNVNVALGYVPLDSNAKAVSAGTADYVVQAIQSNITQVGALSNLTVTGTIDAVTVQANTIGNVGATLIGNGSQLTSITGGQVTGFVANATNAITATYVTGLTGTNVNVALGYVPLDSNAKAVSAGTADYVVQAIQSNITQVGVLSNLQVSGTIDAATIQSSTFGNAGAVFNGASFNATTGFNGILGAAGANTALISTLTTTGNATVSALTVNGTASIGSTFYAAGGVQNTAIGNLTQSTGKFTTLEATSGLQNTPIGNVTPASAIFTTVVASGNVVVPNLTINSSATLGTTLGVTGNIYTGGILTDGYYFANGAPFVSGGGGGFTNITAQNGSVESSSNTTVLMTGGVGISVNANSSSSTVSIAVLPGLNGTFDFGYVTDSVSNAFDMGSLV
jgi:hypothetical protein